MLDPEKTRERERLLQRLRDLTNYERELWELKKQQASGSPIEKQFAFYLNEYLRCIKQP